MTVRLLLLLVPCVLFCCAGHAFGAPYYVAPDGSNTNPGSLLEPWQTLAHAVEQLSAGDTLNLRQGTYHESMLSIGVVGTASEPVVIQSFPGELAVIDGGVPDFRTVPNTEWELVDGSIGLYRSTRTFPGQEYVNVWLLDDDLHLIEYESDANIESTNYGPVDGLAPIFTGPGVQLRDDARIYIRLEQNPNDLIDHDGEPIAPIPTDTDPRVNRIAAFTSGVLMYLEGAGHIHFKDLEFAHSWYLLDVRDGSHHLEFEGCRFRYGRFAFTLREGGASDFEIHRCEFNNGLPDYVYWTDVKNRPDEVTEAYPEFQSAAITSQGAMPGFYVHDNVFRDSFDGMSVAEGSTDVRITDNVFRELRDDAINLNAGIGEVEVAHNILWHVGSGISCLESTVGAGDVFIHHNIIDISAFQHGGRPGNYREDSWPVWQIISPFASHDSGERVAGWKLYNNTIIARQSGYTWNSAGPGPVDGNPGKYVFNNIFYIIDDRVVFRGDHVSQGSHYDGNVVYRNAPVRLPLFFDFGDGGEYETLAAFWADSGTDWELNGLEEDPGYDIAAIDDPAFVPDIIDRYRPTHPAMFTLGASYADYDWPGTEGVDYRGAVGPLLVSESGHCADGVDNDGDGDTDCGDSECAGRADCPGLAINRACAVTPTGPEPPLAEQYRAACRLGRWTLCPEAWLTDSGSETRLLGEGLPGDAPSLWLYQHSSDSRLWLVRDTADIVAVHE